jgi:nucleotide-binding universal stress UspA family protein
MQPNQQLVMDRPEQRPAARSSDASSVKTILLHILDDEFHDARIETALALARAGSAHVSCLHVTPIEAYVAFDNFGGIFVMNDVIEKLDERDYELKKKVEERLKHEDVSWDYEQVTGNVASTLISRASLADLLVTTHEPRHHDFVGPTIGFLGDLLHRSSTPLFIPAFPGPRVDPAGTAVIAWNGSVETANAVRASLGLLRVASKVRVFEVAEEKPGARAFPGTKLLEYLSRQGVHAELTLETSPTGDVDPDVVAGMIIAQAEGAGAAYVVMGAYSHSRVGEWIFGGVTRALLKDSPVALVTSR